MKPRSEKALTGKLIAARPKRLSRIREERQWARAEVLNILRKKCGEARLRWNSALDKCRLNSNLPDTDKATEIEKARIGLRVLGSMLIYIEYVEQITRWK